MPTQGLRWYPPIAGMLAKKVCTVGVVPRMRRSEVQVPPGGDTINGYFVPEGVAIGYVMKLAFLCGGAAHSNPQ